MNKSLGNSIFILHLLGAVFCGLLGLGFIVMAVYLAYAETLAAGKVRLTFLMMPMINILISSMLFFESRQLSVKALRLQREIDAGVFVLKPFRASWYDMAAILGVLLFIGIMGYFMFFR